MLGLLQIGGFEVAGADCRDDGRAADLREGLAQAGELFLVFEGADDGAAGTGELGRGPCATGRHHHPAILLRHVEDPITQVEVGVDQLGELLAAISASAL